MCSINTTVQSSMPLSARERGEHWMSVDNVAHHRKISEPLPQGVAPVAHSDMFKSAFCFEQPTSKSWEHRLTLESASRVPSTLKGLASMHTRDDTIPLGTGRPSSEYFPFNLLQLEVPRVPHFQESNCISHNILTTTGKYDIRDGKSLHDLSVAMNYGYGAGSVQLLRFITEHVEIVHRPKYSNWGCCLTTGSTSALEIVFRMFCERGDAILTEEFSYSGALEAAQPLDLKTVGVRMDGDGLLASDLDAVLTQWDTSARGSSKPFLLYTIPTGHNPTGATQPVTRRQEIYAIAEKHDLLIVEDDPYYFLQLGPYSSSNGISADPTTFQAEPADLFLDSLVPSLLSLDVSGRVIRLDSTSKILAPGLRCGWLTAPSQIVESFVQHQDVSTVHPSGVSQLVMYKLLDETWGHKGFLEWLMFLRFDFTRRRDVILRSCEDYLPKEVCSWKCTKAGMFHWICLEWQNHPILDTEGLRLSQTAMAAVENSIFKAAVDNGVLCCKGSWFRAEQSLGNKVFFRTTFSATSAENIMEGIKRLGQAIRNEFRE